MRWGGGGGRRCTGNDPNIIAKGLNDRQSSILIGPGHNYARLFWTPFSADISANISKIEIELSIQPQSVHNLFFSANEIATRVIERTDPNSFNDSVVLDDLIRGIGYTAVVRVIGEQGSELESLTTITDFYTGGLSLCSHFVASTF